MASKVFISDLKVEQRLVPSDTPSIYRIDAKTVIKTSTPYRSSEAETMRFIRSRTSIPVPDVYDAYKDRDEDRGILVMEFVEGDVLSDVYDGLRKDQKTAILSQLAGYIKELRSFKGTYIGSIDHTYCEDPVFCAEPGAFGPYTTESEFNEGLVQAMKLSQDNSWVEHVSKFVRSLSNHEIVLTHADISPRNIIIQGDKIVAILDWEMAGYYPEYWEYNKAMYFPDWQSQWIVERSPDSIMKPYPLEHAVLLHMQSIVY